MPLHQHAPARRREIASALGIDEQYAYQIMRGIKTASPALARAWIDQSPEDRLWDLRPDDWHLIWPELKSVNGAPGIGKEHA